MKHLIVRIVALLCVGSCVTLLAGEVWPTGQRIRTSDQNGDGLADLWRRYDAGGQLTEIDRDTNFDGSPDIQEYYRRGVLIRRESDRNFNGQTDLVEEFDPDTQGPTRSVVDIDYDGTADLLVLFRDGRPVFSKQICALKEPTRNSTASRQHDGDHLAALVDPSDSDTSVRGVRVALSDQEGVGLSTSGGLPHARFTLLGRLAPSAPIVYANAGPDALTVRLPHSSRAPPVS